MFTFIGEAREDEREEEQATKQDEREEEQATKEDEREEEQATSEREGEESEGRERKTQWFRRSGSIPQSRGSTGLLSIEHKLAKKLDFNDLIDDFATTKVRRMAFRT